MKKFLTVSEKDVVLTMGENLHLEYKVTESYVKEHIETPKVSVIIPVYNVEKYLKKCLDSLVCQSLKELEFICINDGSTDNSLQILEKYAQNDTRFVVISQENQGQGVARNKGLEIAKGEYIAFMDPDDWMEIYAFEELYTQAKLLKAEVIQFNYQEYNEYSGKIKQVNFAKKIQHRYKYNLNKTPFFNATILRKGCFDELDLHVWARFYSRDFISRAKAIFAPTKHGEDHLFANAVVLNAEKIYYLDKSLYVYRCRVGSAVNTISNDNLGVFENINLFEQYLKENGFYEEFKEEFEGYKTRIIGWHYKCVPLETVEKYDSIARSMLTEEQYKRMLNEGKRKLKFGEWIFSIRNKKENAIKSKIVTILGIGFEIKPKKKEDNK